MDADAATTVIRPARPGDLPQITAIYNHYVIETAITFDLQPFTAAAREDWFAQFSVKGRHRLFVAERNDLIAGYACGHQFRTKAAYDTTVETTIYCAPEAVGQGIGRALYETLFDALRREDVRMLVAGITLPNDASVALHERFGFVRIGTMHDVGRKFDRYWDVAWYELPLRSD